MHARLVLLLVLRLVHLGSFGNPSDDGQTEKCHGREEREERGGQDGTVRLARCSHASSGVAKVVLSLWHRILDYM